MTRSTVLVLAILATANFITPATADILYQIDDGTAELALGIDPGEDMIWMNTFPVQPGGEVITSISTSYGRPGLIDVLNGLQVDILLYEDLNGGSPQDAVLRVQSSSVVANGNTNIQNVYPLVPTEVHGNLVAAILFRNTSGVQKFIGAVDRTAPTLAGRSYTGFAVGLNVADLTTIPANQFRPLEGFNIVGNFTIRAVGLPIPEPAPVCWLVAVLGVITGCGFRAAISSQVRHACLAEAEGR